MFGSIGIVFDSPFRPPNQRRCQSGCRRLPSARHFSRSLECWDLADGKVLVRKPPPYQWIGLREKLWKITIVYGKIHYKWSFSIAMLVYQRVNQKTHENPKNKMGKINGFWWRKNPLHQYIRYQATVVGHMSKQTSPMWKHGAFAYLFLLCFGEFAPKLFLIWPNTALSNWMICELLWNSNEQNNLDTPSVPLANWSVGIQPNKLGTLSTHHH